ncbi:hypothetical protein [Poseidonocella sedimentorum]|uniref:PEP-CTERM protein-sorting domain-containing protein n=1 Tax=Poseidonocella sedimentorum TaxID=871652 RepID=A0A1I6DFS3_9RHOB|nr:hypothetical protein [Poseidonocella sedimentorum]SFR04228.1 PEP-CTERM protein-sorting domain-containing protein [Poseidonocella sedimentorum]
MLVYLFALAGAIYGAWSARRRKGSGLDMAQYAAGYAIALGVLGLFIDLILIRSL